MGNPFTERSKTVNTHGDCLGVIVSVNDAGATARFDGEERETPKRYRAISTYTPVVGDRVLMHYVSGAWLIMGSV